MEKLSHAPYWEIAPGELGEDEAVYDGYATLEAAQKAATGTAVGTVEVRRLTTLEHALSWDDPNFDRSQVFESKRWCVVYKD